SALVMPLSCLIGSECAYTLFIVAIYWITEALPLAVSALLPAVMFPLFGIMASKQVASAYFKDFHLLLTGVICLATSIEKWNLHKRIALKMVMLVGVNPAWLTLGFMISCAFLSMWLSNTSTAAMVMPIVEAVAQQIINAEAEVDTIEITYVNGATNPALELDGMHICTGFLREGIPEPRPTPPEPGRKYRNQRDHMICKVMCLCVAYSSTIGGLTTITGTSTNLIFAEQFNTRYPGCQCINFGSWFILSIPITIIILLLSWVWLQWLFLGFRKSAREQASAQVIADEYKRLGPISYPEIATLVLFVAMALLWFTRDPGFIPGWSSLFPTYPGFATDSTAALVVGLLFFIIPGKTLSRTSNGKNKFQSCMPWEIAILVGGGFALADGCEVSNLSAWIGITEVASNPATITIFLPILAPLAEAIHVNPLYILIPTTLCTSFAFLLPVANPPNAIVFSYGHLKVIDMVKAGLGVNIIGVAVVMLAVMTWAVPLFKLQQYPTWAPVLSPVNGTGP
uniref:Solute carrier family 13 member 1 n=1 Tax=Sphenodon punctatus TaxID=8508 RepID=A0A8D0LC13_SPHPU